MLLTETRVIHAQGNGKRRRAVFASIQDVDAAEIGYHREGNGAFIWAAMAFVVATLLYFVIDSTAGSIAAAVIVGVMGVYLVVDQMLSPGRSLLVFRAGTSEVRCELKGSRSPDDIQDFVNHRVDATARATILSTMSFAGRISVAAWLPLIGGYTKTAGTAAACLVVGVVGIAITLAWCAPGLGIRLLDGKPPGSQPNTEPPADQ